MFRLKGQVRPHEDTPQSVGIVVIHPFPISTMITRFKANVVGRLKIFHIAFSDLESTHRFAPILAVKGLLIIDIF
jgi:hypothetical protein